MFFGECFLLLGMLGMELVFFNFGSSWYYFYFVDENLGLEVSLRILRYKIGK